MELFTTFFMSIFIMFVSNFFANHDIYPVLSLVVFWIAAVIAFLLLLGYILEFYIWINPSKTVNPFEQRVLDVLTLDARVLARKKFQLTASNDFGLVDNTRWQKEWSRYCDDTLPQKCHASGVPIPPNVLDALRNLGPKMKMAPVSVAAQQIIDTIVLQMRNVELELDGVTATGFEVRCLESLARLGWDARATKTTGDQGADIVATVDEETLVVQCKLYSRPVGNKAVQEVAAARDFYRADYAAVVTNSSFTRSACDLASTANVRLVTYVDIQNDLSPNALRDL